MNSIKINNIKYDYKLFDTNELIEMIRKKLKDYIEENIVTSINEKKQLNVSKFVIPRDDFRDIMYWIIDGIKLYQPNPDTFQRSDYKYYYEVYPEQYPAFREKVIRYVKNKSPIENVMLPLKNKTMFYFLMQ